MMSLTEATTGEKVKNTSAAKKSTSESVQSIPEEEEREEVANEKVQAAPPAVDSNAFRIRNEGVASATGKTNTRKESRQEGNCGILDHLRMVYPSAYNIVQTHPAFQEFLRADNSASIPVEQTLQHPILTLDPLAKCSCDETLGNFDSLLKAAGLTEGSFLSEERYHHWRRHDSSQASSWMQLLEPLFENTPNHSASLLLLIVIRMEHAAMTAHSELNGKQTAIVDRLISSVASNEDDNKSSKKNAFVQEPKETRMPLSLVVDAVTRYESQVPSTKRTMAVEQVCSLIPKQFHNEVNAASILLIPLASVLHPTNTNADANVSSCDTLNSMNNGVEVAMKILVDNDTVVSDSVERTNVASDAGGLQPHGQTTAKKSKKKRKKKVSTCTSQVGIAFYWNRLFLILMFVFIEAQSIQCRSVHLFFRRCIRNAFGSYRRKLQ